jgi:hypothetical protein
VQLKRILRLQLPCPHAPLLPFMTNSSDFARIQIELKNLSTLLHTLPIDLPSGYNFQGFKLQDHFSDDDIDNLGKNGALNKHLEHTFAPLGCAQGIKLMHRGAGLEAIVPLLEEHIQWHPNDAVLHKWVDNPISAARLASSQVMYPT